MFSGPLVGIALVLFAAILALEGRAARRGSGVKRRILGGLLPGAPTGREESPAAREPSRLRWVDVTNLPPRQPGGVPRPEGPTRERGETPSIPAR